MLIRTSRTRRSQRSLRLVALSACTVAAVAAGSATAGAATGAAATGTSGSTAAADSSPYPLLCRAQHLVQWLSYLCAQPGDLLDVRIGDVHATQPSLGYDEVYYKLGRYTLGKDKINKKFDDWCEANGQVEAASARPDARLDDPESFTCKVPVGSETAESIAPMKTVVIGPGGVPYLTDGHHTLTSFYETRDGGANLHVRLRVLGNLSKLSPSAFWKQMQANKWVWTRDPKGKPVSVWSLPGGVGLKRFQNDPYRSALYFTRDIGYTAGTIPFQEFYWGNWVRGTQPDALGGDLTTLPGYLAAVDKISHAQTALPADSVVTDGFTAGQLGALKAWNDGKAAEKGEFAKLSKPYADEKPGKIAYMLEYKKAHGIKG
ncbi:ParB/Srx family N-terminal domain-containing protein [Streptomyces sp. NPDC001941]|uniref:ParB/Srx family N-terminal domain-containing protein n=1 Tax=Streptomyces sp. NPDC001941 TaxID=3154659 RepID=UPI003333B986